MAPSYPSLLQATPRTLTMLRHPPSTVQCKQMGPLPTVPSTSPLACVLLGAAVLTPWGGQEERCSTDCPLLPAKPHWWHLVGSYVCSASEWKTCILCHTVWHTAGRATLVGSNPQDMWHHRTGPELLCSTTAHAALG